MEGTKVEVTERKARFLIDCECDINCRWQLGMTSCSCTLHGLKLQLQLQIAS